MRLELRIAYAINRVNMRIDDAARGAIMRLENEASQARGEMHEAFNSAARSLGQQRRQRNNRKGNQS